MVRNLPANAGDLSSIPGLGRSLGEGNGKPLKYSYWKISRTEEPGGLQTMAKSWMRLNKNNPQRVSAWTSLVVQWLRKVKVKLLSCVRLFATPWTAAYHASPSMGFSRQEYWSGLQFPSSGDLPNPGIEPGHLHCRQTLYCLSHQGSLLPMQGSLLPMQGVLSSIPDWEAKTPHASRPKDQTIKQKQYCNKLNKDFKNGPCQKKKKKNHQRWEFNFRADFTCAT